MALNIPFSYTTILFILTTRFKAGQVRAKQKKEKNTNDESREDRSFPSIEEFFSFSLRDLKREIG